MGVLEELDELIARIDDIDSQAQLIHEEYVESWRGAPIRVLSGRLRQGYTSPGSPEHQWQTTADGARFEHLAPYSGRYPAPDPDLDQVAQRLAQWILEGR
jgi:hypothetical protein